MDRPALRTSLRPDDLVRGEPLLPRVIDVEPVDDYRLRLLFNNGEERIFDVKPYLDKGVFMPLKEREIFEEAWVEAGSIEWPSGAGLSYNTLYLKSVPVDA